MARPRRQSSFQGSRLRDARQELSISQADLAQKVRVHRATLIRWESNLSAPTPEQEEALAAELSRPRSWFVQDEPTAQVPVLPALQVELSTDEKLEVLLNRVGRIERRLEQLAELLHRLLADR